MEALLICFIMTEGFGYIEPQRVNKLDMSCGKPGAVIGIQIDSLVNPTKAFYPDPGFANMHCVTDISQRIQALPQGEYHIATTELGDGSRIPYYGVDPHTSVYFLRVNGTGVMPKKPSTIRIQP